MKEIIKDCLNKLNTSFQNSAISAYSGQSAFFMMLSFFPFMMFFFSILNFTPLNENDVRIWALAFLPSSFQDIFSGIIEEIYSNSGSGTISVTIITALWLSSKSFYTIQQGLNSMYSSKETRNYFVLRFFSIIYSFVFALLLVATLGFMVFGNRIQKEIFPKWETLENIVNIRTIIIIPVLFIFFMILYMVLPNRRQHIKQQIPGALFSSLAWIGFSYLFSIYVDKYNHYATFYGAMTTVALVMLWLYWCMYVLFIGGFINRYLEKYYKNIKESVKDEYHRNNNEQEKC